MIIILLNDSYLGVAIFFLIWDNLGQHQDKLIFWATCPTDKLFSNPAPNTADSFRLRNSYLIYNPVGGYADQIE